MDPSSPQTALMHKRAASPNTSNGHNLPVPPGTPSTPSVPSVPSAVPVRPSAAPLSAEQLLEVEGLIDQRVRAAMKDMSEKHEFIINKLVAAVDAEFTLMGNRMKVLEAALREKNAI